MIRSSGGNCRIEEIGGIDSNEDEGPLEIGELEFGSGEKGEEDEMLNEDSRSEGDGEGDNGGCGKEPELEKYGCGDEGPDPLPLRSE